MQDSLLMQEAATQKGHMLTNRYIVNIKSILGAAHLVPELESSKKFWVNYYINLETFNDICCQSGPIHEPAAWDINQTAEQKRERAGLIGNRVTFFILMANV